MLGISKTFSKYTIRFCLIAVALLLITPLHSYAATVTIGGSGRESRSSDENQDIIVNSGATYTVVPPSPTESTLKLKSLVVKQGGTVTHLEAEKAQDGKALISNTPTGVYPQQYNYNDQKYYIAFSGIFKPTASANTVCMALSSKTTYYGEYNDATISLKDVATGQSVTAVDILIGRRLIGYIGNNYENYYIKCFPNLISTHQYQIDSTKVVDYGSLSAQPQQITKPAQLFFSVGKSVIESCADYPTNPVRATYYSACGQFNGGNNRWKVSMVSNPRDFISPIEGSNDKGLTRFAYPFNSAYNNWVFKNREPLTSDNLTVELPNEKSFIFCRRIISKDPWPDCVDIATGNIFGNTDNANTDKEIAAYWRRPVEVNIEVADRVVLDGIIDASGKGFPGGQALGRRFAGFGPGAGGTFEAPGSGDSISGFGGTYGGVGGPAQRCDKAPTLCDPVRPNTASVYGSNSSPIDLGSGGSVGADHDGGLFGDSTEYRDGGSGGGKIKLVTKDLIISSSGQIKANGLEGKSANGGGVPGAGAGGSIWLTVSGNYSNVSDGIPNVSGGNNGNEGSLYAIAANGTIIDCINNASACTFGSNIQAFGGQATGGTGGGGGGRIAIYATESSTPPPSKLQLIDTLPDGTSFNGVSGGGLGIPTISGGQLTWNIPTNQTPTNFILKVKIDPSYCDSNPAGNIFNRIGLYNNGRLVSPPGVVRDGGANIICPLNIEGDTGSVNGNITNSKINIIGPAVLTVRGGAITSDITPPTQNVLNYNSKISQKFDVINDRFNNLEKASLSFSKMGPGNDLSPSLLDTPRSYLATTTLLDKLYKGFGTIIIPGDGKTITLSGGSDGGALGIATTGANTINVTARDLGTGKVGIYAPNSTVKINPTDTNSAISWNGFIIANSIEITDRANVRGGKITWNGSFGSKIPPGFSDLLSTLTISEQPPEN